MQHLGVVDFLEDHIESDWGEVQTALRLPCRKQTNKTPTRIYESDTDVKRSKQRVRRFAYDRNRVTIIRLAY